MFFSSLDVMFLVAIQRKMCHVLMINFLMIMIKTVCTFRRMAENGFAPPPPPREFCRHILSCRELNAKSFKRCLHSVPRGVSL